MPASSSSIKNFIFDNCEEFFLLKLDLFCFYFDISTIVSIDTHSASDVNLSNYTANNLLVFRSLYTSVLDLSPLFSVSYRSKNKTITQLLFYSFDSLIYVFIFNFYKGSMSHFSLDCCKINFKNIEKIKSFWRDENL